MANERVSQLNELLAAELQTIDLFLITDMSLKESKKLELGQLILFLQNSASFNAVYAQHSISASYVPALGVDGTVRSASNAVWTDNSGHANTADTCISASWADRSGHADSASWAPQPIIGATSSYALRAGYSDYAGTAYFLYYNGLPNGTASWAQTSSLSLHTRDADTASFTVSSSFAKRTGMVFDSTYFTESNLSTYQPSGFHGTLRAYLPFSPDYYPQTFHKYTLRSYITSGPTKYYSDPVYCTVDDPLPSSGWKVDLFWNAVGGVTGYYLEMSASNYAGYHHTDADSFTGSIDIPSPVTNTFLDEGSGSWNNIQVSFPALGATDVAQYVSFNPNAFPSFVSPVKAFAEVTWSNSILLPKLAVQSNVSSITYLSQFTGAVDAPTYTHAYICSNFGIILTTALPSLNYTVMGTVSQPYDFTERGLVTFDSIFAGKTLNSFTMSMVTFFDDDYFTNIENANYRLAEHTRMTFMVLGA